MSETGKYPEFADISTRFTAVNARRRELEKTVSITAAGGAQELGGWPLDEVISFAKELETLDIEVNALFYKLKAA